MAFTSSTTTSVFSVAELNICFCSCSRKVEEFSKLRMVPCDARHHPHRTHDLHSGSQDHHPSKNSVQKTVCCNSTSNAPDDGRMYPKYIELRIHQQNYLVTSSWHFTLFYWRHFPLLPSHLHLCLTSSCFPSDFQSIGYTQSVK